MLSPPPITTADPTGHHQRGGLVAQLAHQVAQHNRRRSSPTITSQRRRCCWRTGPASGASPRRQARLLMLQGRGETWRTPVSRVGRRSARASNHCDELARVEFAVGDPPIVSAPGAVAWEITAAQPARESTIRPFATRRGCWQLHPKPTSTIDRIPDCALATVSTSISLQEARYRARTPAGTPRTRGSR